jgi:glycerol kinase
MSGRRFVLAIDQGTTSTRAIAFDEEARVCASAQVPLTQIYPAPGEVEHDPEEIWQSVLTAARAVLKESPLVSPISARRRSCGTAPRPSRLPTPSSGRTAAPQSIAIS